MMTVLVAEVVDRVMEIRSRLLRESMHEATSAVLYVGEFSISAFMNLTDQWGGIEEEFTLRWRLKEEYAPS